MPSNFDYKLMQNTNWIWTKPVRLYKKVDYNPRVLQKKTKYNLQNFNKHNSMYIPYKPYKAWTMDMKEIYHSHPSLKSFVDEWLTPKVKGLPDGWYALVGFQYKTRFCRSRGRGCRDFRWCFKFRVDEGNITEYHLRSNGKKSGRHWNWKGHKNRPVTYFAIVKLYAVRKKLGR